MTVNAVFIFLAILFAARVALRLWRVARVAGLDALLAPTIRLADLGWGAALVPVAVAYLWVFGALSPRYPAWSTNVFNATTAGGLYLLDLITLAAVTVYAVLWSRSAGYLAAVGATALGAWVLFESALLPNYGWVNTWYTQLRDGMRWPEAAVTGFAFLTAGFVLTRRTIVADVRARRGGLTAQVERLTRTRAEAVDSAATELRRLERDLHDGAQARLVAIGLNLRTAERLIESSPVEAAALVADCRRTASVALSELRDLVRGIFPPVLADRGLGAAIEALALDCPLPAPTRILLPGRPPAPVESAVYFAVAELLSNAVKHADATRILIGVSYENAMLRVQVEDDGIGGADPTGGTGLAGVERRLAAFDGILAVSSPVGGPTIVVIEVPCALSSPKISTC